MIKHTIVWRVTLKIAYPAGVSYRTNIVDIENCAVVINVLKINFFLFNQIKKNLLFHFKRHVHVYHAPRTEKNE